MRQGDKRAESTPLHLASYGGFVDVVKLLLDKGADSAAVDNDGSTPLHYAAIGGKAETVKLLLEYSKDDIDARDLFGRTSLFWASARGYHEVVEILRLHGSAVDARDHYGATPLLVAVRNGNEEVVKRLLPHSEVDVNSEDALGRTFLWWASRSGKPGIVQLIREKGGISDEDDLNLKMDSLSIVKEFQHGYDWLCDVCTRPFSGKDSSYQCDKCAPFSIDVCMECFEAGARCLDVSHELTLYRRTAST
jgi:ankyrin repeat protein